MKQQFQPEAAWIFDVDGVITDLHDRRLTNPEMIGQIISKLQNKEPVGLISGRGLTWLRSRVVEVLERSAGSEKDILDLLFVSGEFGGAFAVHKEGKPELVINKEVAISPEFIEALSETARQFTKYVFVDNSKETQFTVELNHGLTEEEFKAHRGEIVQAFEKVVQGYPQIQVHFDRGAVNVKDKKANKHYATEQFLRWLSQKGIAPQKIYAFGDSPSDLEIGEELYEQGCRFEFVYVGEKEDLHGSNISSFPITYTVDHCDKGTLEYLRRK